MANRSVTAWHRTSGSRNRLDPFTMILACCGNNCGPQPGCHIGPQIFAEGSVFSEQLRYTFGSVYESWCRSREDDHLECTADFCDSLAGMVSDLATRPGLMNTIPLVIGGDHSCAIGTWRGVSQIHGNQKLGIVWCDAHLDSHTPTTSHSGAIHGMPFAALCGFGHPRLISESIDPLHSTFIGTRSYEGEEVAFARAVGATIYYIEDLNYSDGSPNPLAYEKTFRDAVLRASNAPGGIAVTIDLDGFDPEQAKRVSCPEPGGLDAETLIGALFSDQTWYGVDRKLLRGLEIAEFNPAVGDAKDDGTVKIMDSIINKAAQFLIAPRSKP